MLNLSNILSFSRAGLALAFLQDQPSIRVIAIVLAMLTDFFDGFFARRQGTASQFGAILDPIMDKFFVFFAAGIFFVEMRLHTWQFVTLLSRDISLCAFALYLGLVKGWKNYECKAIWWGKLTTAVQFVILITLCLKIELPFYVFIVFVVMACFAFYELVSGYRKRIQT